MSFLTNIWTAQKMKKSIMENFIFCAVLNEQNLWLSKYFCASFLKRRTLFKWDEVRWDASQLTFTCSKSTIETLEKGVKYVQTYVNFEHISQLYLVFLFSTLNKQMLAGFKLLDQMNRFCKKYLTWSLKFDQVVSVKVACRVEWLF